MYGFTISSAWDRPPKCIDANKNISIYIDLLITTWYKMAMGKRKMYNTTLDADLIKEIRILAAQLEKRQNDLLEEAIQDLLKKYKSKSQR